MKTQAVSDLLAGVFAAYVVLSLYLANRFRRPRTRPTVVAGDSGTMRVRPVSR